MTFDKANFISLQVDIHKHEQNANLCAKDHPLDFKILIWVQLLILHCASIYSYLKSDIPYFIKDYFIACKIEKKNSFLVKTKTKHTKKHDKQIINIINQLDQLKWSVNNNLQMGLLCVSSVNSNEFDFIQHDWIHFSVC